jgi:fermentation-respiration switch protein FrsA (DUF1100 family)
LVTIASIAAALWLALCVLAYVLQEKLIFFPGPPPSATPRSVGLEYESVELTAADGARIAAWWIPAPNARRAVVLCHGNAGSIENRIDLARQFHEWGWSTLSFDYRGFGASTGKPSVAGVALDADAAYDFVAQRAPGIPVLAWGESLGGAVAAELSTRRAVDVVVLESSFTSLADIGGAAYPILPVRWILRGDLDTRGALARTNAAVFVLHGEDDTVVPYEHATKLFEAARGRRELCRFHGGHNDRGWAADASARECVRRFVEP